MRIESVSPLEPEYFPDSFWLNVVVSLVLPMNQQRRYANRNVESRRVNIWDLALEG